MDVCTSVEVNEHCTSVTQGGIGGAAHYTYVNWLPSPHWVVHSEDIFCNNMVAESLVESVCICGKQIYATFLHVRLNVENVSSLKLVRHGMARRGTYQSIHE